MGRSDRFTHHSDYRSVPEGWLGASFLEEAERLRERDERAWRHMYLGEQTGTGASVFENLSVRAISEAEISGFGACYMGLDFGWFPDPLHWVKCAYHPASKRLWVFDEYRAWRQTNFEAYCALRESGRLEGGEEVIADSAERKSVADMRAYGLRCVGASKGPGSVRASIKWLQGLSEIVIDPARCPYAAREFLEYEYERTRDGEIVAGYPDRDNHGIDAVRYALNRVWTAAGT